MRTKFIALLLLLFTIGTASKAQKQLSYTEIDSLIWLAKSKGDFGTGIPFAQTGKDKAQAEFGTEDTLYAAYTNALGLFYSKIGQHAVAEKLLLESLRIYTAKKGTFEVKAADCLINLSSVYSDMGQYDKAERFGLQALGIREKTLGTTHADYIGGLTDMGRLYATMSSFEKAEECYLKAKAAILNLILMKRCERLLC